MIATSRLLLATLVLTMVLQAHAAPDALPAALHETYDAGVEAYRNGDYDKALKCFKKIVKEDAASQEGQYYYAITLAQLGRFREARGAYETVIRLAPGSEAAQLARRGVEYLPAPDQLDRPPQFQARQQTPAVVEPQPAPAVSQQPVPQQQAQQPQTVQTPFGAMDPQMMQMMMMMNAMGGGGGFNPMMIPMMQSMMRRNMGMDDDPDDNPYRMSPDMMSTMMMNQMLQDFSPFGPGKND